MWKAYKNYIEECACKQHEAINNQCIDDILIYAIALDIDKDFLEFYSEKLVYDDNTENLYMNQLYYYPYFYIGLMLWDDIDDNINNFTSDNGDSSNFGGFSGGGDCSGGGGGGSGAF